MTIKKTLVIDGITISNTSDMPKEILDYLVSKGSTPIEKDGYKTVAVPFNYDREEMRRLFPDYFSKYIKHNAMIIPEYFIRAGGPVIFSWASSTSKKNNQVKHWIYATIQTDGNLKQAARDVFNSQICNAMFGKNVSHKVKFDHAARGVAAQAVNTGLQYDSYFYDNFASYLKDNSKKKNHISKDVGISLINMVIVGMLSNEQAIHAEDFISVETEINSEYNNDNYKLISILKAPCLEAKRNDEIKNVSFQSLLPALHNKFNMMFDIMLPTSSRGADTSINSKLELSKIINQKEFNALLDSICTELSKDNYRLCYDIKKQMEDDLNKKYSRFTKEEIEGIVIPEIDQMISDIKKNIEFYQSYQEELSKKLEDPSAVSEQQPETNPVAEEDRSYSFSNLFKFW